MTFDMEGIKEERRMREWYGIQPSRVYCVKHVKKRMDPVKKTILIVGGLLALAGVVSLL